MNTSFLSAIVDEDGNFGGADLRPSPGQHRPDPRRHSVATTSNDRSADVSPAASFRSRAQSMSMGAINDSPSARPDVAETLEQKIARVMAGINNPAMKYTPSYNNTSPAPSPTLQERPRRTYGARIVKPSESMDTFASEGTITEVTDDVLAHDQSFKSRFASAQSPPNADLPPFQVSLATSAPAIVQRTPIAAPPRPLSPLPVVPAGYSPVPRPPPAPLTTSPSMSRIPLNPDGTAMKPLGSPAVRPFLAQQNSSPPRGLIPVPAGLLPVTAQPVVVSPVAALTPRPQMIATATPRPSVSVTPNFPSGPVNRVPFGGSERPPLSPAQSFKNTEKPSVEPAADSASNQDAATVGAADVSAEKPKKKFTMSSLFRAVSSDDVPPVFAPPEEKSEGKSDQASIPAENIDTPHKLQTLDPVVQDLTQHKNNAAKDVVDTQDSTFFSEVKHTELKQDKGVEHEPNQSTPPQQFKRSESLDEKIERLSKEISPSLPEKKPADAAIKPVVVEPSEEVKPPTKQQNFTEDLIVTVGGVPIRRPSIGARASSPLAEVRRPSVTSIGSKSDDLQFHAAQNRGTVAGIGYEHSSNNSVHSSSSELIQHEPPKNTQSNKLAILSIPTLKLAPPKTTPSSSPVGSPVVTREGNSTNPIVNRNRLTTNKPDEIDDDVSQSRPNTGGKTVRGGSSTVLTTKRSTVNLTPRGNANLTPRGNEAEMIRDGDFSMRTRTSTTSSQRSANKAYNVGKSKVDTNKIDSQDPTRYSYDTWSLSRQMKDDDISSVGAKSEIRSVSSFHTDGSSKVFCRVRPMSVGESQTGARRIVSMNGDKVILVNPNAFEAPPDTIAAVAAAASLENMRSDDWAKVFRFDSCLWSFDPLNIDDDNHADQLTVHESVGQHLVRDMLKGIPVTCFAYGHTGTGKSYTMFGDEIPIEDMDSIADGSLTIPDSAGLIPRVFTEIIHGVYPPNADPDYESDTRVTISFLEIHQERIKDLLIPEMDQSDLRIREHPTLGPYVDNLTKIEVKSAGEMLQVLHAGSSARATSSTMRNLSSSRSHAIVTLEMTPYDSPAAPYAVKTPGNKYGTTSKAGPSEFIRAQMIDLAGSEKEFPKEDYHLGGKSKPAIKTREEVSNERLELKLIRKSLSTLGYIIKALSQGVSVKGMPFRDSSLTWLLKDALTGNCSLTMLATISPADICYEETLNTLKYADRLCTLGSGISNIKGKRNGAISIDDTIDPQLSFVIAAEFSRLKQELSSTGQRGSRQLLKQTISDPQQRLAKLSKPDENSHQTATAQKRRHSGTINTPNHNALVVAESSSISFFSPPTSNASMVVPSAAAESSSMSQLRETYRQLHGRFIELQIELENARTDRDGLQLEIQSLRDALDASKNNPGSKPPQQSRMFLAPSNDMGSALLAAEDEIAELKSVIQRKEETADRLLNELGEERQIRSTIERTAKAQVMDLIARVEALQKQLSLAKEEAADRSEEAISARRDKETSDGIVNTLKDEILRCKEEINAQTINLESVIDSLRRQVNELIKERESLDPRAKEAQREKEDMLQKMQTMVLRIDELNGKLEECYRQLGRTESDLKEAAREKANWMDRENAWVRRVQEIQSTLERVERDKATLLAREGSLTKQVLDMEVGMAGGEARYKSQLDTMTLERDSLVEIVKQQGQALHVQQQQAESSLKMLHQRQAALERIENRASDTKAMDELSKLQDELHGLFAREGRSLQSELMDVKQLLVIVGSLKDKFVDMDMLKDELHFEQKERRRLENKLADMIDEKNLANKDKHGKAIVESALATSDEMIELREQVKHFQKLSSGWEARAQHWQQIAKKQVSGEGNSLSNAGLVIPSLNTSSSFEEVKRENDRLAIQLAAAISDANTAKKELATSKEDMQKEFTSLWLAVQQLNALDAEKERALQDLISDRDSAIKERNDALEKLRILEKDYEILQSELEAIDSDLLRAADEEGIAVDIGIPVHSRQSPADMRPNSRGFSNDPHSVLYTPVLQQRHKNQQQNHQGGNNQRNQMTGNRNKPFMSGVDGETEQNLERQIDELSQFLERDKYKSTNQQSKEKLRGASKSNTPRR